MILRCSKKHLWFYLLKIWYELPPPLLFSFFYYRIQVCLRKIMIQFLRFYLPNFWVKRIKKKIEFSCPIFLSFLITKNIFINKVVFEESYKTFLGFTFRIFVLKILKKDEIFTKFFPTSFLHPCVYIKHFHYSNFIHLYLNFTCLSVCLLICY